MGNKFPGPPTYGVTGDEDKMRTYAAALEKDAEQLRKYKKKLKSEFSKHECKGPKPDKWAKMLDAGSAPLTGMANELDELAAKIRKAAKDVVEQRDRAATAYRREAQRLADEAKQVPQ